MSRPCQTLRQVCFFSKSPRFIILVSTEQNSRCVVVADGIGDLDVEPDVVQGKAAGGHAHPDGVFSGRDTGLHRLEWDISGVTFLFEGLEVRVAEGWTQFCRLRTTTMTLLRIHQFKAKTKTIEIILSTPGVLQ